MQNIFIIEAVSTGRFYAKEIAWRGYHPVVIYPYLENITDVYKQYRIGGSDYAHKFTDDIIFMDSDSSEAYQALLDKFQPVAVVAGSRSGDATNLLWWKPCKKQVCLPSAAQN